MARPSFIPDLATGTFTFSNGQVTIEGQTNAVPPLPDTITVQSVTLTNHHHNELALGISGVEVPPHLFDLLI
jgi:hypothetical protein